MPSPRVSVIIPVYNDPEGVRLTLESVTGQTYPTDEYEILVVDNDSADGTAAVIETYADRYGHVHALAATDGQSPAAARNEGIRHARGDVLAFIDANMTAPPDWLATMTAALGANDWDYAGCEVDTYPPEGRRTLGTLHDDLFAFRMADYLDSSQFVGAGCLVVRRSVIDAVGDFDAALRSGEDKEFGDRVAAAGFAQGFVDDVTLHHPARATVRAHVNKAIRIGRGQSQLGARYPDRFGDALGVRSVLPLNPLWFRRELRRREPDVSRREALALWCLGSANKLARTVGRWAEAWG